jgi:hypothetical protein
VCVAAQTARVQRAHVATMQPLIRPVGGGRAATPIVPVTGHPRNRHRVERDGDSVYPQAGAPAPLRVPCEWNDTEVPKRLVTGQVSGSQAARDGPR